MKFEREAYQAGNNNENFNSEHNMFGKGDGESPKEQRNRVLREQIEQLKAKFSGEFVYKPFLFKTVQRGAYTETMKVADTDYIDRWKVFHIGKNNWHLLELEYQYNQRLDMAKDYQEQNAIRNWYFNEKQNIASLNSEIFASYNTWRNGILTALYESRPQPSGTPADEMKKRMEEIIKEQKRKQAEEQARYEKEREELRKRYEDAQKNGGRDAGAGNGSADKQEAPRGESRGRQGGNEQQPKSDAESERIAMRELGITQAEYDVIVDGRAQLSRPHVIALAEKIFGVSDGSDVEVVKKAFKQHASMWHPDKQTDDSLKEVNTRKFQIINAFYNNKYKSIMVQ